MGGGRLRGSSRWLRNRTISSADRATWNARGADGGEKHRAHDSRSTIKAVPLPDDGNAGQHRPSHRGSEFLRIQVLRVHCLVDVALGLSGEASAVGEETASDDSVDAR